MRYLTSSLIFVGLTAGSHVGFPASEWDESLSQLKKMTISHENPYKSTVGVAQPIEGHRSNKMMRTSTYSPMDVTTHFNPFISTVGQPTADESDGAHSLHQSARTSSYNSYESVAEVSNSLKYPYQSTVGVTSTSRHSSYEPTVRATRSSIDYPYISTVGLSTTPPRRSPYESTLGHPTTSLDNPYISTLGLTPPRRRYKIPNPISFEKYQLKKPTLRRGRQSLSDDENNLG